MDNNETTLRHRLAAWVMVLGLAALGGCDWIAQRELKVGESTVDDVRKLMGKPEMIWEDNDGSQTLEYVRGPTGHHTYFVRIGPDRKYRGMAQALTPENFAKVRPGMSSDDVRRLLGKETERNEFKLKQEIVWSWRYIADQQRSEFFNVHFDPAGKVKNTSRSMDQRGSDGN